MELCTVINHLFDNNKKPAHEIKSWSDLPDDIVRLVIEHLCYSDQIRCRAVCKSWESKINGVKCADKLPWLFSYENSLCHLYDPYHQRKHTIKFRKFDLGGAKVLSSNYGWLLFSKSNHKTWDESFFFYNPFTDEIINLPALPQRDHHANERLLFSASPTSPNCVIFSARLCRRERFCVIKTCCPRDTTWTLHSLDCVNKGYMFSIAYLKGILYCVFTGGSLGAFNAATKEWKVYSHNGPLQPFIDDGFSSRCLLDSEGNLLMRNVLCLIEHEGKLLMINVCQGRAFFFDWDQKKWIEVTKSLDNKMLFIDYRQCNLLLSVGEDESELAKTVHHCNWLVTFYLSKSTSRVSRSPQPYHWIKQQSVRLTNIWVQPPQIR